MDKIFFEMQIQRLKTTFGDRPYSEPRVELIWKKFHIIDNSVFELAVNNLISNSRYAPLVYDFDQELAGQMTDAKQNRIDKITQGKHCHACNNTGRVSVQQDTKYAPYSYRCHCTIGRTLYPNFPLAPAQNKNVYNKK